MLSLLIITDINECLENINGCDEICMNTQGSYNCMCSDGFTLQSDNHTCHGMFTKCVLNNLYLCCDDGLIIFGKTLL